MSMARVLAIAAIVVAAACSSSTGTGGNPYGNNPPPPPPPNPPPPPPPPPPPGPTLSVSVGDNVFTPANGSVTSGGTVTWSWGGAVAHNVTFEDTQSPSGDKTTGTHQRTFSAVTTSTTFRYRCTIHSGAFGSGMSGQIVVVP